MKALHSDQVLFEDNHLIAINKPPGVLVQGDKSGDISLLDLTKQYIKKKYKKPGEVFLGLIHRIDRPVSGVVLFARTSKALERMNKQFREKETLKTYWAVCKHAPPEPEGNLIHYLRKNSAQNKSYVCKDGAKDALKAELHYKWINQSNNFNLLEIELITGRHHQIRAQLAHIGCPIKGDLKYGAKRSNPDGSIHLHAKSLSITHPVKKEAVTIHAKPPHEPLWNFFSQS